MNIHFTGRRHRTEAGFSMIELLVCMSVMLIIFATVFTLMGNSLKVSTTAAEMSSAQSALRTAHEYLNRDLTTAGNGLKGINNIRVPIAFVSTYLSTAPVTDPSETTYMNLAIITSDNDVPAATTIPGTGSPLLKVYSNTTVTPKIFTDRLTVLEEDVRFAAIDRSAKAIATNGASITVTAADAARVNVGEVYFVSSTNGAAFGTITSITNPASATPVLNFASGDTCLFNKPVADGPLDFVANDGTGQISIRRMRILHYFVNQNGLLIRRVFGVGGGVPYTDSVLAEHVTNLQFRYGLNLKDTNGFMQQPTKQLSTEQQQVGIREVEAAITIETTHALSNGVRQPITMTTSTSVRDMQFRQALEPNESNGDN
jgi:prepilin-type N-terminal cleavage/methylation domain-containing protein